MRLPSLERAFRRYGLVERGLKPQTLHDILIVLRRLCAATGTDDLRALDTSAIRSFLQDGRLELGWSARTFRLYRQYLKTFFAWCCDQELLPANPVEPIAVPRLPQQLPRCLSQAEARRVLYAAGHAPWRSELQRTRNEAIVATFLMSGLRRRELLDLREGDLDLDSRTLTVRAGKGRKDRTVPLHPRLVPILSRYLAEKRQARRECEWVFTSLRSSKRLTSKNLYSILEKISQEAGVKFSPHMLRHTFGRELVEADFNIYKLKEVMGHASVSTTQGYVALSPQSIKRSFERLSIY